MMGASRTEDEEIQTLSFAADFRTLSHIVAATLSLLNTIDLGRSVIANAKMRRSSLVRKAFLESFIVLQRPVVI